MRFIQFISILVLALLLNSCVDVLKPVVPAEWTYQKEGIILDLISDPNLNQSNGKAYTLFLVVYQLTDPNAYNQLCQDQNGLLTLLKSKVFDSSVAAVKNYVIYPGRNVTYKIDRSEGAQYVGVVAGYHVLEKSKISRLYEIPVKKQITDYLRYTSSIVPQQLQIKLILEPSQVSDFKDDK